jgi:kinesin family protein C2/C3
MNGYGGEYGVSYRTMHKVFEVLHLRKAIATKRVEKERSLRRKTSSDANCATSVTEESSVMIPRNIRTTVEGAEGDSTEGGDFNESEDEESVVDIPAFDFSISVSMMEIYNETVRDLLSSENSEGLEIRQSPEGGVHVPGLVLEKVSTLADAMRVFARGSANRATMTTNMNEYSSRSHSILMVDVVSTEKGGSPVCGKLFLVDLAGSERVEKSGVTGAALKEAQYINKSLSALGDVMEALDQKSKHIPYRNSKLTYLLQDSLGGNSRTMMIVTICPTELSSDESLFALQFATRVRRINLGPARKNINAKNLEESVRQLKNELRDSKKKRMLLEESVNEMKREVKRTTEKLTSQTDTKTRVFDDAKRSYESQIKAMEKTTRDLAIKVQEEKAEKSQLLHDLDVANKAIKKIQDQLKSLSREKEILEETLKDKERELSLILMSEALNEKPAIPKKKRPADVATMSGSSGAVHKHDGIKSPVRKEEGIAATFSDASGEAVAAADYLTDTSPPQPAIALPESRILRSGRVVRAGSAPSAIALPPSSRLLSVVKPAKASSAPKVEASASDSPPPKKSAVVLKSSAGSLQLTLTKAAVNTSISAVSVISNQVGALPKYPSPGKASTDPTDAEKYGGSAITGDAFESASIASSIEGTVDSEPTAPGPEKMHLPSRIPALRSRSITSRTAPAAPRAALINPSDIPGHIPPTQRSQEALLKHQASAILLYDMRCYFIF